MTEVEQRQPGPTRSITDSSGASDKETDAFEDAIDAGSVRSLTGRNPSTMKSSRPSSIDDMTPSSPMAPSSPAASSTPLKDADEHGVTGPRLDEDAEDATHRNSTHVSDRMSNGSSVIEAKLDDVKLDEGKPEEAMPDDELEDEAAMHERNGDLGQEKEHGQEQEREEEKASGPEPEHESQREEEKEKEEQPAAAPPLSAQPQSKKLSLSNITGSLPTMPWSPNPSDPPPKDSPSDQSMATSTPASDAASAPARTAAERPAPASRKLTSPFSWLTRNSQKDATSPPSTSPRRNTASSVATLTSNPEMMLSKLEEGDERGSSALRRGSVRNSLKDRFKLVRMREEAGITMPELTAQEEGVPGPRASLPQAAAPGAASPTQEVGQDWQPPLSPGPTSSNHGLAPGTVSGATAGPADSQVDWDLWQTVVYEGPSAVARTSPEELNRAIATGIPNVIRGVVWQVLAQSKNEELELVYRDLLARGTEKEKDRYSHATSTSSSSNGNLSVDKETVASSASSVHSEHSGINNSKPPPTPPEKDTEALLKAQAVASADRKKRDKEDTAMVQKLEKIIRRDLGARTSYSKYMAAAGLQDGLFGVCKAYALFDEGVGYAQGMNFLIMPLLFNMPEEEAFCLLVRLMNQYKLRELFIQDMPGLHKILYQFERLLEDLEPALYCHLHRRGISGHLYATQWFLTLFAYRFPLQLVLRIYDLIFSEGLSAILRFGIVLMQKNTATLRGMSDMAQLTSYLKDKLFDVYIDQSPSAGSILENGFFGSSSSNVDKEVYRADQFVHDACEVKLTPELLKAYTVEWEEKTRAEKEREQEVEDLKQSNTSYAIKVRKLEGRLQAADSEQTSMANELVHTKIENEELKDENESLRGQVKELRIVVDRQPEELEKTWQAERDNLMQRNEKVHEENQRVEKEMSELEEELVQTKMRYAEINAQYETLQRKWADLKRHMA